MDTSKESAGPPSAATHGETQCLSCSADVEGEYCGECGERRLRANEFSLRRFLTEAVHELVGGGRNRLWQSLKALATRPGELTREYVRGRRKPYLTPIQLFLLANLIYFFVEPFAPYSGYNTTLESQVSRQSYSEALSLETVVSERAVERGLDEDTYARLYDLQSSGYAKTLVILMVPMLAVLLAVMLTRRRRPLVHHLVFALHYYAWELLFISSIFLLVWGALTELIVGSIADAGIELSAVVAEMGGGAEVIYWVLTEMPMIPLVGVYLYLATRRFYELSRAGALTAAVLLVPALLLITIAYRFLLFWITYATV